LHWQRERRRGGGSVGHRREWKSRGGAVVVIGGIGGGQWRLQGGAERWGAVAVIWGQGWAIAPPISVISPPLRAPPKTKILHTKNV